LFVSLALSAALLPFFCFCLKSRVSETLLERSAPQAQRSFLFFAFASSLALARRSSNEVLLKRSAPSFFLLLPQVSR
jgi:hypothetical protein